MDRFNSTAERIVAKLSQIDVLILGAKDRTSGGGWNFAVNRNRQKPRTHNIRSSDPHARAIDRPQSIIIDTIFEIKIIIKAQ